MIDVTKQKISDFEKDLENLLNKHSMENGSDTPDYMLADYLCRCLEAYNATITKRQRWYNKSDTLSSDEPTCLDDITPPEDSMSCYSNEDGPTRID